MKVKVVVSRPYGSIEVEGESLDEMVEELETFPEWLAVIDKFIAIPEVQPSKEESPLESIIELTSEGPQLVISKDKISIKEAIAILLYAQDPLPLEPKQIGRLLNLSGHGSPGFGSRVSEMRREGIILRDGQGYRISITGKKNVEDLIQRLKQQRG